jgi:tripeptide aminopeptidase
VNTESPVQETRLNNLFRALLSFDAPAKAEKVIVAWVRGELEQEGFEVWEDDAGAAIGGNANNLIVKLPATGAGPNVFLSAHFDTVESTASLRVIEENGVYRTDGASILGADDRCGVAAAIEALRCLRDSGISHGNVYLLLTVAEEIGLLGAKEVDFSDLNLDYGFVLDTGPPVGGFVLRAATHDNLSVTIHGTPAHAGKEPEKGVDAIAIAADAISRMKLGRLGPETTANIGVISGGTAANVVPANVHLIAEARSTDEGILDEQIDHMIRCFTDAAAARGGRVSIDHHRHYRGYEIPEDSVVARVADAAARSLGLDPARRTTLGGSDGNVYNERGLPCVVLATGMDKIHTHQEQITHRDLLLTAQMAYQCLVEANRIR